MDLQVNLLINLDVCVGFSLVFGVVVVVVLLGVGGVGVDFGLGGFVECIFGILWMKGNLKLLFVIVVVFVIVVIIVFVLWSCVFDYCVLYSNLLDCDGGVIIVVFQQVNVFYKFVDVGGVIFVLLNQVYEMCLKFVVMGLLKGGLVGFELMDNQKFGISQFVEQINYQCVFEGELQCIIELINVVCGVCVYFVILKLLVFVCDKEVLSVLVFVDFYLGCVFDEGQVQVIMWMVLFGVFDMLVKNVMIVDQDGNLLIQIVFVFGFDVSQFKYVQQVEYNMQKCIDVIFVLIFGVGNVCLQVSVDFDFLKIEQMLESYGLNGMLQ